MSSTEPNRSNINKITTFENLSEEDGSLIPPAAVGIGQASVEGDSFMSDEEGKVMTTLEAPKASPKSAEKVIIHSQTIIKHGDAGPKARGHEIENTKKTDDLLSKMKSRLSKQIDLKMISPTKSNQKQEHDASGSIEIPHDLILSSDIPATPLASSSAKELEDHDLIAILEGDDVEITESATEIEVRVGGGDAGVYNDDQVLEEIQISFVDENELEQKEREKEIAMRQMANLPVLPKGRRPKPKAEPATPQTLRSQIFPLNIDPKPSTKTESPKKSVIKSEPPSFVTIKGQTTIKAVPKPIIVPKKEPEDVGIPTTQKIVPISKSTPKIIPITQKLPTTKSPIASSPPVSKQTIPVSKPSPNELISSLVSDWDDEPIILKHEPVSPEKTTPKSIPSFSMPPPPTPPAEEPKRSRIIKKKIIWDPDNPETHMSFASFVKSNRTKPLPEQPKEPKDSKDTPRVPFRPPGTGIRRKRAESVAVHMIKDPPYTPPPSLKRARTPEPISRKTQSNASNSKSAAVVRKKKSEIEKLLGDEGAINMLYDVECENSNKDLLKDADIKVDSDDEDEKLLAKAKIITDAVIKQGTSPNDTVTHIPRVRAKRASTPQQTSVSPLPTPITITPSASNSARKTGTTTNGPSRKRKQNSSASNDWDYVYNSRKTSDDAMIIRRRSNSSYSSSTSPRRLSVEQAGSSQDNSREDTNSPAFEFVKPTNKASPKPGNVKLDSSVVANMKGKLSKALGSKPKQEDPLIITLPPSTSTATPPEKKAKISPKPKVIKSETITTITIDENGINASVQTLQDKLKDLKLKELSCNQCGNYAEIVLAPKDTHLKDVFTVELINELKFVLNLLKSESSVRAVLIKSSGKQFCRGIDVSYLIQTNAEKRKSAAQILSGHLRNFLQALAMFNKPLVAAVHGDVLGIGVTILPLFEVVIASESATFSTPYALFGHLPEAMKLFTSSKNLKPKAITDLLYLNKKVSASTALDYGIITEIATSEKLQDKASSITKKIGSFSTQALKSIKANLRQDLLTRLDDHLISEQKKLTQQWITPECQEKFKQFVSRGGEW